MRLGAMRSAWPQRRGCVVADVAEGEVERVGTTMIYEKGFLRPSDAQIKTVCKIADDSFCSVIPKDFGSVPNAVGWLNDLSTAIALRLKCVEPHKDDWVGGGQHTKTHASIFWLLKLNGKEPLILQVGNDMREMRESEFIVFDDSKYHGVFAKKIWTGIAIQARKEIGQNRRRRSRVGGL